ncbi:MAG: PEP-CTERM system TPR-repeat protein PrsT [Gammaproteobacteria bacterium]|nr:PEP-CTERM system TPR-repeat protein PrsT [Gammaproteobacteria bacterium]
MRGKKLFITVVLYTLMVAVVYGIDDQQYAGETGAVGQYYENALMRFGQEDYRGAVVQLKNALQQNSRHLPSRILLGRVYLETGSPRLAEMEFALALEMGADRVLIDIPLAETYTRLGRYRDLVAEIDPARHLALDAAQLKVVIGRAYLELKQYDLAKKSLEEAVALDPQVEGVMVAQALYHLRRQRIGDAKRLLDSAIESDPQDAEAWFLKAKIAYQEGRIEQAIADLTNALDANPDYHEARLTRAAFLNDIGQLGAAQADLDLLQAQPVVAPMTNYLQAIVHFRKGEKEKAGESLALAADMLSSFPPESLRRNPLIRLLAGTVAYVQGNFETASDHLNLYLEWYPGHVRARQMMTHIHLSRNQPDMAYKALKPLLREKKNDPMVQMLLGQINLAMKDDKAAAQVFQKLAAQRPDDAGLQMKLAKSLVGSRQVSGAIEALEKAKQLGGRETAAGLMLANLQLNQGNYEQVVLEVIPIVARDPENLAALNLLGLGRMGIGDLIGARDAFSRAQEVDGTNLYTRLNLGRVDIQEGLPERARGLYQAILNKNPSQRETLIAMAELDEIQGQVEAAIRWREKVRGFYPSEVASNLQLIVLYLNTGKPQQALVVAQALKTQHPENYQVAMALGISEIASGNLASAKVRFKKLAHWVSYDAEKLQRIARYQKQLGDFSSAYWSLIKAVDSEPDMLVAVVDLTLLEIQMGKTEDASGRVLKLQMERPGLADGYFMEGEIHLAEGSFGKAESAYLRAWELRHDSGTAIRLFQVRQRDGRAKEAIEGLEAWTEERPADMQAQKILVAGMIRSGRYIDAQRTYEGLLETWPENTGMLNNLAMLYQMSEDPRALEMAEKAYRLAPRDPLIADTLGWVLVSTGKPREGLHYLREAQSRNSNLPDISYHLALALEALGRKVEARKELEKILKGNKVFSDRAAAEALLKRLVQESGQ